MLKFRDVRAEDRQELFSMQKEFYSGPACNHEIPETYFEATLNECLRSQDYARCLIMEDETGIVGYCLLSIYWSTEAGGLSIWIEEVFLKQGTRGKGYGTQVFSWVEEEYPDAKRYRLEATYENEKAIALYERLGYKELFYHQMVKDKKEL